MRRFGAFNPVDLVKPEFVTKCSAEHLKAWTKPLRGILVVWALDSALTVGTYPVD